MCVCVCECVCVGERERECVCARIRRDASCLMAAVSGATRSRCVFVCAYARGMHFNFLLTPMGVSNQLGWEYLSYRAGDF